ncbi:MAG: hypothetical protein ABI992_01515 [Chthoniobacterales bacterium]
MPDDPEPDLRLEIAHVLLIDVVGYSKLLVNEQIEVLQKLNLVVRNTDQFRTAEANGKLMRLPTGDGMALLFFDSAETPVECALAISRAAKELPQMPLRMGAHSGPIKEVKDVNDRSNFAGAGINTAQRVLDAGDAGHILLSKHLAEDLSSYRHWNPYLHDLGECEVKHGVKLGLVNLCKDDLGNPAIPGKLLEQRRRLRRVQTFVARRTAGVYRKIGLLAGALLLGFALWTLLAKATVQKAEHSVAVLPFGDLSDEKNSNFFVDGVQDEILTDLSKVRGLKVISRTSVMQYKPGLERNLREIARGLGVSHLLEGDVQRIGNRVRVHAQLIEAKTEAHVWADRYDGELADVFAIQSQIAERIVAQLRLRLSFEEKAAIEERPTENLEAYDLYARAKALIDGAVFSARAEAELNEAARMLEQAVARDPQFYLAFYQLAHARDQLFWRFGRSPAQLAAAAGAVQALETLRPGSGEAHLARAKHLYWAIGDHTRAREELAIARRALPNDPVPALLTGYIDRREGRWDDSNANLQRALELDPRNPSILQQIALTYFSQRRFEEMARVLDRAVALVPDEIVPKVQRATVDLDWRADTKPLHTLLENAIGLDPTVAVTIADHCMELAVSERDPAAAVRALSLLPANGCASDGIPFPKSWCEGITARLRGDNVAARAAFTRATQEAEQLVRAQPDFAGAFSVLGMAEAALGRKEEAITHGRRAVELLPVSKDAVNGPLLVGYLAVIYAWTGEKDQALDELERATSIPSYWSYGNLRLNPNWDPLRGDPRFEKIVASLAPK